LLKRTSARPEFDHLEKSVHHDLYGRLGNFSLLFLYHRL
jgi:hypothetical protein